jgi:sulfite exporter TauE/SafE
MITLLTTVFVASIVGSLHCAGMCGPFAWLAAANTSVARKSAWPALAGYHGSRLILYSTLGMVAGSLGYMLDLGGASAGIQRGAAWLGGIGMIIYGLLRLIGGNRWFVGSSLITQMTAPLTRWLAESKNLRGWRRAALIGGVSSLMPCGWLYAFVLAATGTGSPLLGSGLMIAFWLGTVPILSTIVLGMGRIAQPIAARAPVVLAVAVLLLGFYTVTTRGAIDLAGQHTAGPIRDSVEFVRGIEQEKLPCCCDEAERK